MNVTLTRTEGIRPPVPPWGAFAALIFLFGICGPAAGDVNFPDDHGDTASTATPLALPATVNAEIEIDTDKDFFSFSLEKGKQYTITVSRDGIRDIDVALLGLSGQGVLARFDSVVEPSASFTWPNLFGDITAFLRVGGFAEFTTGGYTLHVDAGVNIVDSDNDGLPDVWELYYFGNLNQGPDDDPDDDHWTNLEELYLGTDPMQADAGLRIRTVDLLPGGALRLDWPAAPLRIYRVDRSSTMAPPSWSPVGTVTGTATTATMLDATAGTATQRYYRVELEID